jgi:glutamate synthase (NADPH/NADH) large chain
MTGGTVAVLGRAGINFAAGMTGGLAWVYDEDGSFFQEPRYHPEFVTAEQFGMLDADGQASLRALLERHAEAANSSLAKAMLVDWENRAKAFVRLSPKPQG